MTNEEALDIITLNIFGKPIKKEISEEEQSAFNLICRYSIMKQVAVIPETDGTHRYCPTCGQYFGKQHPRCYNCGQKLEWTKDGANNAIN